MHFQWWKRLIIKMGKCCDFFTQFIHFSRIRIFGIRAVIGLKVSIRIRTLRNYADPNPEKLCESTSWEMIQIPANPEKLYGSLKILRKDADPCKSWKIKQIYENPEKWCGSMQILRNYADPIKSWGIMRIYKNPEKWCGSLQFLRSDVDSCKSWELMRIPANPDKWCGSLIPANPDPPHVFFFSKKLEHCFLVQ